MNTIAVTVIMPAYNAAETITEAATSILDERIPGLELLVIDDGSTDGTGEVLAALDDPRIRVVRQQNAGLVAALNCGLDEATGQFVARMDADDTSVTGRLAAQLAWLRARPWAVACGTDYELFEAMTGRVRMPRTDRACRQRLALASCHCGASLLIRRAVIERAGMRFDPDFAHAEDYEFITRLAALGELGNLPIVGYRYRIHESQVSSRHAAAQQEAHIRIAQRYAAATRSPVISRSELNTLLWPASRTGLGGRVRGALRTGAVAIRVTGRRRGVETVRFTGRKVVEAAARR